jgi:hypothetical protein
MLPYVFVDGDSIDIVEGQSGNITQMTKPYVYHAEGAQKLKNLSGQALATELENMVQHKFVVMKEAIPEEKSYQDALTMPQKANTLVVNAFKDDDPNIPIPNPISPVTRIPAPPEISNAFTMSDQVTQSILGSYDAALGINDNQLSGVAIVEAATQSNAAAMPYIVNYLQAWTQVANIIIDLIPKYWKTPRTVPVIDKDGKRSFAIINTPNNPESIDINYDSNALQVQVKAGVNFQIQKARALQQIIAMTQASPIFAEFMNTKGLEVLLDNFEIRGIDILKELAVQFKQEVEQRKQAEMKAAQEAQQNNPMIMKAQNDRMKIMSENKDNEVKNQIAAVELQLHKEDADNDRLRIMAQMQESFEKRLIQLEQDQTRKIEKAIEMAMKAADLSHSHHKEAKELDHLLKQTGTGI